MNDKNVIPCRQCHGLLRVPTDRGLINIKCPHCQANFLWTPNVIIIKKKCLNCGYERQEKDDQYGIIPSTECPKCHAIYKKVEKIIKERERECTQERIRLREEQKMRDLELERERRRLDAERIAIKHGNPIISEEQQARYREALRQEAVQKDNLQQQHPAIENIGWFKKKRIEATTKNIIRQIVKQVDFTLRANPSLSLEEALIEVNKRGVHLPDEENFITDLSSLFVMMVYKAYYIECFPYDIEALNRDRIEFVVKIANDYMNMVMSNSGLQPSVSEAREDKIDQRYPWYAGIGAMILFVLLRHCGAF